MADPMIEALSFYQLFLITSESQPEGTLYKFHNKAMPYTIVMMSYDGNFIRMKFQEGDKEKS